MSDLKNHVESIARDISNGVEHECCPECGGEIYANFPNAACHDCSWEGSEYMSGFDYLSDALDIQYIVTGNGDYLGARVLVAFGGPNIWIDTQRKRVEGHWWSESFMVSYSDDAMDIDDALSELWACR